MRNYIKLAAAISVAMVALTGCGGSTDSTDLTTPSTDLTTQIGYFIDAEVRGLDYKTSSGRVGKTNNLGQFFYQAGDTVSFSIGNLALGQAQPSSDGLITPAGLALAAANGDQVKADAQETLTLRVLQSCDSDNNPVNGITIDSLLSGSLANIPETSISDNTESSLLDIDANLTAVLDEDGDGIIDVTATAARAHAGNSLATWNAGVRPGDGTCLNTTQLSNLTNDQKYSLAYMWNEERLAQDIYLALNAIYPTLQFENIATRSEINHIAAVESLVKKYDINILNLVDYTVNYSEAELRALPAGTYNVEEIQNLYDDLYAIGQQSKIDALKVACMVEVTDVNDLDDAIEVAESVNATDLVSVYTNLRAGSYNHYWQFDSALKIEGVSDGCASLGAEYAKTEVEYPRNQAGQGVGQGGQGIVQGGTQCTLLQ